QTYPLSGVPVPGPGAAASFRAVFTLQGVTLRFGGIHWQQPVIGAENGVKKYDARFRPAVELETQGPTAGRRLTLRVTDEGGRLVSESTERSMIDLGQAKPLYFLDLRAGVRKVNLTF